jgi:hypothetical protein
MITEWGLQVIADLYRSEKDMRGASQPCTMQHTSHRTSVLTYKLDPE